MLMKRVNNIVPICFLVGISLAIDPHLTDARTKPRYSDIEHTESDHGHHVSSIQISLLLITVGLLLGALIRFFQRRILNIPIPYTVVVLLLGNFLGISTEYIGRLGDAVIQVQTIDPHALLAAFIPALIYESAFDLNFHIFSKILGQALLLAGPGVLINAALTVVLGKFILPHQWSWAESWLFGAIVCATDPVAVVALLKDLGASRRLGTLIEGESLLNDGTAFVLFMIALDFVKGEGPAVDDIVISFLQLALLGPVIGVAFGLVVALWHNYIHSDMQVEITLTILTCYLVFHVAEVECKSSGVLACVFLGVTMSKYKLTIAPEVEHSLHHVWQVLGYIATTLIFLYGGIVMSISGALWQHTAWLILIYFWIHVTRAIMLMILWFPMNRMGYGITFKDAIISWFGALRGVIGLAMAMITELTPLPGSKHEEDFKAQVMFYTTGIVLLTLCINAVLMKHLVKYLGVTEPTPEALEIVQDAMKHLREHSEKKIEQLRRDYNYAGADWDEVQRLLPVYEDAIHMEKQRIHSPVPISDPAPFDEMKSQESLQITEMTMLTGWASEEPNEDLESGTYGSTDADSGKLREFQHRILNVMLSFYVEQFEEGAIGRHSAELLEHAVEVALDTDDLKCCSNEVLKCFEVGKFIMALSKVNKKFLFLKLRTAVECGSMFMQATTKVVQTMQDIPKISGTTECQHLLRDLEELSGTIRQEWLGLQQSYHNLYRAIQTNLGVRKVMHAEGKEIDQLRAHGLLDDMERDRMKALLAKAHDDLKLVNFHKMGDQDKEKVLAHLPFCEHLNALTQHTKIEYLKKNAKLVMKNRGEIIHDIGDKAKTMVVMVRGTVEVMQDGARIDTKTTGSILAWEMLVNKPFQSRLLAKTSVEFFSIRMKHLDHILEGENDAMESLWKSVGLGLIFERFRHHYPNQSRIEIYQTVADAGVYKSLINIQRMQLNGNVLLMKGSCASLGKSDMMQIHCPAMLPQKQKLRLNKGCVLLILDTQETEGHASLRRISKLQSECLGKQRNDRLRSFIKSAKFRPLLEMTKGNLEKRHHHELGSESTTGNREGNKAIMNHWSVHSQMM